MMIEEYTLNFENDAQCQTAKLQAQVFLDDLDEELIVFCEVYGRNNLARLHIDQFRPYDGFESVFQARTLTTVYPSRPECEAAAERITLASGAETICAGQGAEFRVHSLSLN